jgi:Phosphopantothenoylcysteine synthetase/decarboxylase
MGFALAEAAERLGAKVTLVAGPVALATPAGVRRVDVTSAEEMLRECGKHFPKSDIFIATAAVGDYAPKKISGQKLKKSGNPIELKLAPTPDILKTLAARKRNGQIVVGFAAETENVVKHSRAKLRSKRLDLIVANDVSKMDRGFGTERNAVIILTRHGETENLGLAPKSEIAMGIMKKLISVLVDDSRQADK